MNQSGQKRKKKKKQRPSKKKRVAKCRYCGVTLKMYLLKEHVARTHLHPPYAKQLVFDKESLATRDKIYELLKEEGKVTLGAIVIKYPELNQKQIENAINTLNSFLKYEEIVTEGSYPSDQKDGAILYRLVNTFKKSEMEQRQMEQETTVELAATREVEVKGLALPERRKRVKTLNIPEKVVSVGTIPQDKKIQDGY